MPLTEIRQFNDHTLLGFWEITETPETLTEMLQQLRPEQEILFFKSELRQKEWLASRLLAYRLLAQFTSSELFLTSDENGKPQFSGSGFFVSISQSGGRVAVILSDSYEVGIDIEIIREKILALQRKFLSETELQQANNNLNTVCLYWSAKETLYKLYSRKKLLFIENLQLGPVSGHQKGQLSGQVTVNNFSRSYTVLYEKTGNFILTYSIYNPENPTS